MKALVVIAAFVTLAETAGCNRLAGATEQNISSTDASDDFANVGSAAVGPGAAPPGDGELNDDLSSSANISLDIGSA